MHVLNGHRVSFWDNDSVLEINRSNSYMHLMPLNFSLSNDYFYIM